MEINEKKLKNILQEEFARQRQEFQSYMGALTEDFTSQVRLIAESVEGIQTQLISLKEMVAKNTEDIMTIKMDIEAIKQNLRMKVDITDFQALEKRVSHLETKIK